jgi:hypothetical protein
VSQSRPRFRASGARCCPCESPSQKSESWLLSSAHNPSIRAGYLPPAGRGIRDWLAEVAGR